MTANSEGSAALTYKGLPLVRCGREMYFGKPEDSYVVFLQILSVSKDEDGVEVPSKMNVQLLSNDRSLSARARIVKQGERSGLYEALDIGYIWLQRALSEKAG